MKTEEIIDGNKLIAEFMDFENFTNHEGVHFIYRSDKTFPYTIPAYHTSWDWLMPVVEKIEDMRFQFASYNSTHSCNVRISQGYVEIEGTTGKKIFRNTSVEGSKIKALWLAVIDFINWYEEMNPKNIFTTTYPSNK